MTHKPFQFLIAVPVWEKNKKTWMNHTLEYITTLQDDKNYTLYITGSSSYLILVNDTLVAYGPARAAHGFYKVDHICLKDFLSVGENVVTVRCTGYNINSFSHINSPSFLCAEIRLDDEVIVATGLNFHAFTYPAKIRKTQRYSYQRTFAEAYNLSAKTGTPVTLEPISNNHVFIERDVPYCEYQPLFPQKAFRRGTFATSEKQQYYSDRAITDISKTYKGFAENDLTCATHIEYGKLNFSTPCSYLVSSSTWELKEKEYIDLDMGVNQTGLFSLDIDAQESGTLIIAFDELLLDENFDPFRNLSSNIILLTFEPGNYHFVSAEPYTLKYIRLITQDAPVTIRHLSLLEIAFPESLINTRFQTNDAVMQRIFDAAKLSFRANVVDIYMDCPSRERAGWLCDSFFTARVEKVLTGKSVVEKAFLETFLLPDTFKGLPDGMLPMCYPADVMNGEFIPNWSMWYALELYEYFQRTNDSTLVRNAKFKMEKLLTYFKNFENHEGLLCKLDGVVFVDASRSNKLAQEHDISFPTNMLYAAFQSVLGILYNSPGLIESANNLRDVIQRHALTETGFFRDCADQSDNHVVPCDECTETCQYYAFFFRIATPETHPKLWNTLISDFGYDRATTKKYAEIAPANAFIGNYLRLNLLEQYGYTNELYDNIRGYFAYMAEQTGTLWEYILPNGSCNHGYASHVIYWMNKLGLLL